MGRGEDAAESESIQIAELDVEGNHKYAGIGMELIRNRQVHRKEIWEGVDHPWKVGLGERTCTEGRTQQPIVGAYTLQRGGRQMNTCTLVLAWRCRRKAAS